ncbi:hypothetical protein [Streptosporangium fragile]|uniref:hypothetical protein n=1 Tax=Streptosporangium fragile TaxID=46186 RepID=UPI0031E9ED9A
MLLYSIHLSEKDLDDLWKFVLKIFDSKSAANDGSETEKSGMLAAGNPPKSAKSDDSWADKREIEDCLKELGALICQEIQSIRSTVNDFVNERTKEKSHARNVLRHFVGIVMICKRFDCGVAKKIADIHERYVEKDKAEDSRVDKMVNDMAMRYYEKNKEWIDRTVSEGALYRIFRAGMSEVCGIILSPPKRISCKNVNPDPYGQFKGVKL